MEGKGKYIFDDDSYAIGEFKNNKRNGKGKQYDNNNNLIYDGFFVDDQREGFGKLFDNNKILYEGLFVKNEIEGNGKYYIKDNYFVGNIKLGSSNFKGKVYTKKDELIYEGEFKDYKYQKNGKFYYINGNYYME